MITLFFAYSHQDETLRNQLEIHLSGLKRQGLIDSWHDRRITAGEEFNSSISDKLEKANIVLLLVSADFIASDYCYNIEMKRAMERHHNQEATVIPVILRPCDWHDTPFAKLQAVPKDAKPVVMWPNIDEAFLNIVQAIKTTLEKNHLKKAADKITPENPLLVSREPEIRSSNLRIPKQFTERDTDKFLHDSFDYIAKFFENSLNELAQRNPGIEIAFRRLDSNRFTAAIYRNGNAASRCTVFLHGFGKLNHIGFSSSDNGETTSFNESLSVESGEQDLYLKPSMYAAFSGSSYGQKPELGQQGGAEALWAIFLQPLQVRY